MACCRSPLLALCCLILLDALLSPAAISAPPATTPVIGIQQNTPTVYALTGLKIVVEPGRTIEMGTIVLRDGVIEDAGEGVSAPADARVLDMSGRTAYAGFIDAYTEVAVNVDLAKQGAASWNAQVGPQIDLSQHYAADEALNAKLRSQGITARLLAPSSRIIKGQSIVVSTGSTENSRAILKSQVAQHFRLTIPFGTGSRENYPNSPMGAVALARQTMLDADWYRRAWAAWANDTKLPRPERNDALEALAACSAGKQLAIFDTSNEQFLLRADRFAREFGLRAAMRGSGREYRRLADVAAAGRAVIVPVNYSQPPSVGTLEDALDASLAELMQWDLAPENPGRLDAAGVAIALTSTGLRDQATFLSAVRRAVDRGLKADSALKALTTTPARLLDLEDRHGKIAAGMAANLVIADGALFGRSSRVVETWVDGRRFEIDRPPVIDARGTWELEVAGPDGRILKLGLKLSSTGRTLSGVLTKTTEGETKAEEIRLSQVSLADAQLTFRFDGKTLGKDGPARASATLAAADPDQMSLLGTLLWADGTSERLGGMRKSRLSPEELRRTTQERVKAGKAKSDDGEKGSATESGEQATAKSLYPVNYPLGDFGRSGPPEQPRLVAFKNATVWTCGPAGKLESATVLVEEGKIVAVGQGVRIPEGAKVIDAEGRHITPGIIDCHSHMATDGGVNESAQAITAEVRIGDFIDAEDINVYRQLAGGVTSANVLHGSANPIGGQNQVIKLRWGATGEAMKFDLAPPGIKLALGENVKQSNLEARLATRFPQSRMGVDQLIRDAFARARDYSAHWERWNSTRVGLPPRRDLEMDTLVEILQKKRWVHCHSYRQDEILALIRTFDDFGITIGSLQHILEGYKVADAMARHGATGSTFSDWWAYKFEVIDAIPFNGALMHRQGIIVSFNSDDDELGRHLNHEAAKAMKYGGVPRDEALKFVTLNPARQLRIDAWVGSLEAGKHADLVVWSSDPLAVTSRCEQTWIDGRKYFDREEDRRLREEQTKMRVRLIRKVLDSGQSMQSSSERQAEEWELWPRHDEFCHDHDEDH